VIESDLSPRQVAALAPVLVLVVGCLLACLVDIWRGPLPRYLPRLVWTLVVLTVSPWGPLLYLFVGRVSSAEVRAAPSPVAGTAPICQGRLTAPEPAVRTVGLYRDYGAGAGVFGADLVVPRRGVHALVGPNGSGKTTLLAMVAGMRRAQSGQIMQAVPAAAVAVCPDVPEFEPWLTAREVVDLARRLTPSPRPPEATALALAEVGLADSADRRVGGFSRGMTQRLGLAVGLVGDPEMIIMDEPTAALDPAGRVELARILVRLGERIAVLLSSHDLAHVRRIAATVTVMSAGWLVYQGPTAELAHFAPGEPDLERAFLALTTSREL
jgi:ABC-2 type transport system ATP-binding protein